MAATFSDLDEHYKTLEQGNYTEYEKLFYGCNLKPIRRYGKKYIPKFSHSEIFNITKIMKLGLKITRNKFRQI